MNKYDLYAQLEELVIRNEGFEKVLLAIEVLLRDGNFNETAKAVLEVVEVHKKENPF
jgi:hypothetical protein